MGRFVKPVQVRLPISNGDWIDIREQLTHGERDAMMARFAPVRYPGEKLQMHSQYVRTATVLAFLMRWSLTDDEGAPVPIGPEVPEPDRVATINGLDTDSFDEIEAAINAHVEARDREKKAMASKNGKSNDAAISPSLSAAAGVLTGSGVST